jgi:periplasmic copper chaperone A
MRSRTAALLPVLVAVLSLAACGGSSSATGGGLVTVSGAWVRAAAAGSTSAAYMTITNGTLAEEALVGASTAAAANASIHQTTTDSSGMTGMRMTDQVTIPAGKTVMLEPGGYHIMLENLTGDLAAGSTIQLTLTFEHAGPLNVRAEVRAG